MNFRVWNPEHVPMSVLHDCTPYVVLGKRNGSLRIKNNWWSTKIFYHCVTSETSSASNPLPKNTRNSHGHPNSPKIQSNCISWSRLIPSATLHHLTSSRLLTVCNICLSFGQNVYPSNIPTTVPVILPIVDFIAHRETYICNLECPKITKLPIEHSVIDSFILFYFF